MTGWLHMFMQADRQTYKKTNSSLHYSLFWRLVSFLVHRFINNCRLIDRKWTETAKEQYKEWEVEGMSLRKKQRRGLSTVAHGDRVGGRSWLSFRPCKSAYHSWVLQRNHHAGNPQRSVFQRLASLRFILHLPSHSLPLSISVLVQTILRLIHLTPN